MKKEKEVIWKYEIEISDDHVLTIPAHAEILYLGVQEDTPYIWVKLNPYNKGVKRHFITYGTGHSIKEDDSTLLSYIGTFQYTNGFVGHLFEIG
jgi:hypothetical protein